MNSIKERLDIFLAANIITNQEKETLENWVQLITEYSPNAEGEKLERLITHSAMMMKRQRENEEMANLPDEIFNTIKENKAYNDCKSLFNKMDEIYHIDVSEERYILLHLCNTLSTEEF